MVEPEYSITLHVKEESMFKNNLASIIYKWNVIQTNVFEDQVVSVRVSFLFNRWQWYKK